jgi:Protein of unknown function (DUF3592)
MVDFAAAALIATAVVLLMAMPLFRTTYYALISPRRFQPSSCTIEQHHQPNNDEGEPIQLVLRYRYSVDGREFTGSRYYFGSINECNSEFLQRYPVGSIQTVYFDPKNPSRSTLQTGFRAGTWFWITTFAIAAPIAWIAIVFMLLSEWKLSTSLIVGILVN